MFTRKGIRDFISKGFSETMKKQQEFETEFESTSNKIKRSKEEMQERSKKWRLIRNK